MIPSTVTNKVFYHWEEGNMYLKPFCCLFPWMLETFSGTKLSSYFEETKCSKCPLGHKMSRFLFCNYNLSPLAFWVTFLQSNSEFPDSWLSEPKWHCSHVFSSSLLSLLPQLFVYSARNAISRQNNLWYARINTRWWRNHTSPYFVIATHHVSNPSSHLSK